MRPIEGALPAIAAALGLAACGIPVQLERISRLDVPTKGMRYVVHRPTYRVVGRLDGFDSVQGAARYAFTIEQVLDEASITYEARTSVNPLTSTEFTVGVEDDGGLSSIVAGETDKTLEVVKAAAGLAKTFAPADVAAREREKASPDCKNLYDSIRRWESKHETEMLNLQDLQRTSARVRPTTKAAADSLEAFRREMAALLGALKGDPIPLDEKTDYGITVNGKLVKGSPNGCIKVTLTQINSL